MDVPQIYDIHVPAANDTIQNHVQFVQSPSAATDTIQNHVQFVESPSEFYLKGSKPRIADHVPHERSEIIGIDGHLHVWSSRRTTRRRWKTAPSPTLSDERRAMTAMAQLARMASKLDN